MKIITILFWTMLFSGFSYGQKKPVENEKSRRIEKIINSQWTFNYFPSGSADNGYESPGFNDSSWPAVSLPHTWNTYETTGDLFNSDETESDNNVRYWNIGWGWYRKHFTIPSEYSGMSVFVEFSGVQQYCKVWLNGKYLGEHEGGYGSFDFDLTRNIKSEGDNLLVVAVRNNDNTDLQETLSLNNNFNQYGGIFRDVTLVLKDKLYIPMQGASGHEGGVVVTIPQLSEKEGVVRVRTWVKNDYSQKKECTLRTSLISKDNKIVQVIKTDAGIMPGQIYMFDQTFKPVKNPDLWSIENPVLYNIYSEVVSGNIVTDSYSVQTGFRRIKTDQKDNSVIVNGKKIVPQLVDFYPEYPILGSAIPEWIRKNDFTDLVKKMNQRFIRTGSFPV